MQSLSVICSEEETMNPIRITVAFDQSTANLLEKIKNYLSRLLSLNEALRNRELGEF
jgi:hypothetical protein